MERLKMESQAHGLKCGGTLQERAANLFLLKTTPVEKLPKKLLAKSKGGNGNKVPLSDILGGLLLQSPSVDDFDQREIFCLYLFPGNTKNKKPPLWERYQQQLKDWELAMNRTHNYSNGCKEKAVPAEKPQCSCQSDL